MLFDDEFFEPPDDDPPEESDDDPLDDEPESDDDPLDDLSPEDLDPLSDVALDDLSPLLVDVEDFLPRLSVLKKPDPLKVTPTGVNTFFTGSTSPVSGWAISVRVSSWNPWWTSIVSPESTNL